MSITNKLIANIKQTNVDITKFTDTNNVICIDTSNNRIGINTKTPRYAIDICGINSKIFVENLEVGRNANLFTISANTITCSTNIFANNLDVSFINVKTISGSLITGITLSGNTILGTLGNIRDFSAHNITITNNLDVSFIRVHEISANIFNVGTYSITTGDFNNVNVSNNTTTISLTVSTISCETLKANNIICLQTVSAETISSNNLTTKNGDPYFIEEDGKYVLATELGQSNIDSIDGRITQRITTSSNQAITPTNITTPTANITQSTIGNCTIDTLTVKNIQINTPNESGFGLLLPKKPTSDWRNRSLATNTNNDNPIFDNLIYYNSSKQKWSNFFTETHYATLDLSNISSNNLATNYVSNLTNYRYIPIKFKSIKTNTNNSYKTKTDLFFIPSTSPTNSSIDISNETLMNNGIYEINASITVSYTNTISGDVEPNDYTFGLYNKDTFTPTYTSTTISNVEISYNYVKNKNLILAFDNSYNFSSVSLHYIGPLYNSYSLDPPITYRKGLCYLINSQKDISNFNVEYFSSTIKLLNYSDY
jgi:hypothetical protein